MLDIERIHRVMDKITDENLHMGEWAQQLECGTVMCFAGHTVADEGIELEWRPYHAETWDKDKGEWVEVVRYEASQTVDGELIHAVAAKLLGLDYDQAHEIFYSTGTETVAELWDVIEYATGDKVNRDQP